MTRKKSATPIIQRGSQRRKNVVNDFSNGNAEDKEAKSEDEGLPLLKSRCFLANFAKKIKFWQIDDREWALLRKTPFGRLIKDILELDLNMEIVDALLGFWDEEFCGFFIGGIIIPFTVDDIALITGLPNRGQKVVRQKVWFFEHVDFGDDTMPSNPEARPRMLKWAKGCKFWQRKPFLQRLRGILVEKVCYQLIPKNEEFELISLHSVVHTPSQIVESDDVLRNDLSLVGNMQAVGSDIIARYEGTEQRGREAEKKKQETKAEKGYLSEIANLRQVVLEQSAQISNLERKIVNLETLAASKGSEIEGRNDKTNMKVCEQVGHDLTRTLHKPCIEGDKGHTIKLIGHPKLSSITRSEKQGSHKYKRRKMLKSTITSKHPILKRKDNALGQASIPSMENSIIEKKNTNMLVNVDDYRGSTEQKKEASVVSLNYIGRELLTENIRRFLDAFCIKPMQIDDIVFFDWDICIRRHSMVEYLQGGYTREEIIDAYTFILYEGAKKSGNNFASFLYVPPMFLGLYRQKLGSYKTFLKDVNKKSLEKVELLFFPCHISTTNHWLLLVCDMKMGKWIGYDSLYDARHREVAKEQIILLAAYLFQDLGLDIRSWSLEYKRIYPQQEPGTLDCGIFVMKFIESIIRAPMEINFKGTDMQLFRPQIAYKILDHC